MAISYLVLVEYQLPQAQAIHGLNLRWLVCVPNHPVSKTVKQLVFIKLLACFLLMRIPHTVCFFNMIP